MAGHAARGTSTVMLRVVLALLAAGLLAGCGGTGATVRGSGNVVSEYRDVAAFDRIELRGAADVTIVVGRARSVFVTADDNIVPRVHTEVVDGVLVISEDDGYVTTRAVAVDVATPVLVGSTLSGAGSVVADGIDAPGFELRLGGTGSFDLGGTVGRLDVALTGVGDARLEHLRAEDVVIALDGTGSAQVFATGSLDAAVRGIGTVVYHGEPKVVETSVTGLGSVVKS